MIQCYKSQKKVHVDDEVIQGQKFVSSSYKGKHGEHSSDDGRENQVSVESEGKRVRRMANDGEASDDDEISEEESKTKGQKPA